jgi:hypothetical protein
MGRKLPNFLPEIWKGSKLVLNKDFVQIYKF